MPKISVLIVNFNSGRMLAKCLDHLATQTFKDFEVIVIDNASSDDSMAAAQENGLQVRSIYSKCNLGFAAANNEGAKLATGEWLAFLNPDAYPEPDWLQELIAATGKYAWADAFGSTQLDANDPSIIDGAGDVFHVLGVPYRGHHGWKVEFLPGDGECFSPCAAAAMYRRAVFDELGGFDERLFCYGEDVDLGFRLRLKGRRAVQVRNAVVLHEGSGVSGRYSDFTVYHGNRNRIWVTYKNMPSLIYWPTAPLRVVVDLYLLARAWSVGIGRPYWKALRDGYGGLERFSPDRDDILRNRSASLKDIALALTWSPLKVSRREAALRCVDHDGGG